MARRCKLQQRMLLAMGVHLRLILKEDAVRWRRPRLRNGYRYAFLGSAGGRGRAPAVRQRRDKLSQRSGPAGLGGLCRCLQKLSRRCSRGLVLAESRHGLVRLQNLLCTLCCLGGPRGCYGHGLRGSGRRPRCYWLRCGRRSRLCRRLGEVRRRCCCCRCRQFLGRFLLHCAS